MSERKLLIKFKDTPSGKFQYLDDVLDCYEKQSVQLNQTEAKLEIAKKVTDICPVCERVHEYDLVSMNFECPIQHKDFERYVDSVAVMYKKLISAEAKLQRIWFLAKSIRKSSISEDRIKFTNPDFYFDGKYASDDVNAEGMKLALLRILDTDMAITDHHDTLKLKAVVEYVNKLGCDGIHVYIPALKRDILAIIEGKENNEKNKRA